MPAAQAGYIPELRDVKAASSAFMNYAAETMKLCRTGAPRGGAVCFTKEKLRLRSMKIKTKCKNNFLITSLKLLALVSNVLRSVNTREKESLQSILTHFLAITICPAESKTVLSTSSLRTRAARSSKK
uniref:Uncharacterized protein n=1 Tax=Trichogramma kaykai TaxID=54128 RepID=A0ABD2WHM7_9HYME